jgi:predicted dehydrogenase
LTASPLRIGILGAAKIARGFVAGVSSSTRVTVAAVASRDDDKARAFAREFSIGRHFGSYEGLLADREIDAVYIPLPNSLHAEWSIRAVRAGKHVLCEKPLSATAGEARAMFDAARQHGVHLVEGYPYRAQPQTLKLRELVDAGVIGDVRLIQSSFGFTLGGENIRWSPQLAGGALMDIGTYPVSLVRMIAKACPIRVQAVAEWTGGGVDRSLAATLQFESGLFAQIACSFSTCVHRQALIAGSNGVIQTTYLNHTSTPAQAVLQLRVGTDKNAVDSTVLTSAVNGFLAEAESFERLVRGGPTQWSGTTPAESIDIMLTVEAILKSARSGGTIDISPDS